SRPSDSCTRSSVPRQVDSGNDRSYGKRPQPERWLQPTADVSGTTRSSGLGRGFRAEWRVRSLTTHEIGPAEGFSNVGEFLPRVSTVSPRRTRPCSAGE